MLREEAQWFAERITTFDNDQLFPMLNIGSGTEKLRVLDQPYIEQLLFAPIRARDGTVTHSDITEGKGVDLSGDLTHNAFLEQLCAMKFKSIFCSNVLEHVPNREQICLTLEEVVVENGLIFCSVPYKYPYHPDPIDSMFRPNLEMLIRLFPNSTLEVGSIVRGKTLLGYEVQHPVRLLKSFARICVPFYKPQNWLRVVATSSWYFRNFEQTCVVLRKGSNKRTSYE